MYSATLDPTENRRPYSYSNLSPIERMIADSPALGSMTGGSTEMQRPQGRNKRRRGMAMAKLLSLSCILCCSIAGELISGPTCTTAAMTQQWSPNPNSTQTLSVSQRSAAQALATPTRTTTSLAATGRRLSTPVAQAAGYQLQTVPCQNCDATSQNYLPPLPGVDAYAGGILPVAAMQEDPTAQSFHQPDQFVETLAPQQAPPMQTTATPANGTYDYVDGYPPVFPNRPYIIPRTVDRLRQRPLFPRLTAAFHSGSPSDRPHTFWFNPFAIQQGLGNFLFRGNQPADTGSLGMPFSMVPSHVVDQVPRPYIGHGQNYIKSPHIGMGQPLSGTSWTNRPYSIDVYTGAFLASALNENVEQGNGLMSGFRVGWDFEHYWGTEFRMGFGDTRVDGSSDKVDVRLADIGVVYYPWGDARWRPYTSLGLGIGSFAFQDGSHSVDDYALQVPISVGVKYAFKPWWNLRLDFTNYMSMPSSHLDFMNNVLLTGAFEYRFGGRRRSYFPYNPSIHLK